MVITTFHQRSILEIWKPEKVLIYYWNCWSLSTKFMNSVSWPSPFKEPLWLVYCLNVDVIDCTEKFEHLMPWKKVLVKDKIPPTLTHLEVLLWLVYWLAKVFLIGGQVWWRSEPWAACARASWCTLLTCSATSPWSRDPVRVRGNGLPLLTDTQVS